MNKLEEEYGRLEKLKKDAHDKVYKLKSELEKTEFVTLANSKLSLYLKAEIDNTGTPAIFLEIKSPTQYTGLRINLNDIDDMQSFFNELNDIKNMSIDELYSYIRKRNVLKKI